MLKYLVLLFILMPMLELALLIEIGANIGTLNTILLIVTTGVAGAWLAQSQGLTVTQRIQAAMAEGRMPTKELMDGLMIFIGGVVLLTPGVITDVFGLLCLLPVTRNIIREWLQQRFKSRIVSQHGVVVTYETHDKHKGHTYDQY